MKQAAPANRAAQERRQFGRRTVAIHGWVVVDGRPRIPCTVRNISIEGALLEFDTPSWLPYYFRLVIEVSQFETECELRHQAPNSVGVRFVQRREDAVARQVNVDDADPWLAHNRKQS